MKPPFASVENSGAGKTAAIFAGKVIGKVIGKLTGKIIGKFAGKIKIALIGVMMMFAPGVVLAQLTVPGSFAVAAGSADGSAVVSWTHSTVSGTSVLFNYVLHVRERGDAWPPTGQFREIQNQLASGLSVANTVIGREEGKGINKNATTATVNGLMPNVFYEFRMRAVGASPNFDKSDWTATQTYPAPTTPQTYLYMRVAAQTGSDPTLRVTWTTPTADAAEYAIAVQVKRPDDPWTTLGGVTTVAIVASVEQKPASAVIGEVIDVTSGDDAGTSYRDISGLAVNTEYNVRLVVFGALTDAILADPAAAVGVDANNPTETFATFNNVSTLSSLVATGDKGKERELELFPAFSPDVTEYTVVLGKLSPVQGTAQMKGNGTPTDENATVQNFSFSGQSNVVGVACRQGFNANCGSKNIASVRVTAENGDTTDYTINFALAPNNFNISSITYDDGGNDVAMELEPQSNHATLHYTAGSNAAKNSVPNGVTTIKMRVAGSTTNRTLFPVSVGRRGATAHQTVTGSKSSPSVNSLFTVSGLQTGVNNIDIAIRDTEFTNTPIVYTVTVIVSEAVSMPPGAVTLTPPVTDDSAHTAFTAKWSAVAEASGYFVRWRIAAQDPDGIPANGDEIQTGAWQDLGGDDDACLSLDSAVEAQCGQVVTGNALEYEIPGLASNTLYEYSVRGVNDFGAGRWSDSAAAVRTLAFGDANLVSVGFTHGGDGGEITPSPAFNSATFAYTLNVINAATIAIDAAVDASARMKIGLASGEVNIAGNEVSGHLLTGLVEGDQTLNIIVTADDGTENTYTFAVHIDPPKPPVEFLLPLVNAGPGAPNLRVLWNSPNTDAADYAIAVQAKLESENWADVADLIGVTAIADFTGDRVVRIPSRAEIAAIDPPIPGKTGVDITRLDANTKYDVRLILLGRVAQSVTIATADTAQIIDVFTADSVKARTNNDDSTLASLEPFLGSVGFNPTTLSLSPGFGADITDYSAIVPRGNLIGRNVGGTWSVSDSNARAVQGGRNTINQNATGQQDMTVTVTAEDGSTRVYTVALIILPNSFGINSITADSGQTAQTALAFTPPAARTTFAYTAGTDTAKTSVGNDVSEIALNLNWTDGGIETRNAAVAVTAGLRGADAAEITSGTAFNVTLPVGENHIDINFSAAGKTAVVYTITVTRLAEAAEVPGAVTLSPVSDIGLTAFTANWSALETTADSYFIRWRTAATDDAEAGLWQNAGGDDADCNDGNTAADDDCGHEITGGASNSYAISGLTSNTGYDYSVRASNTIGRGNWRESASPAMTLAADINDLRSLVLLHGSDDSPILLSPIFGSGDLTYTATVTNATAVKISAEAEDSRATFAIGLIGNEAEIDAAAVTDYVISGFQVGAQILNIIVIAENGDRQTYEVTVTAEPATPLSEFFALSGESLTGDAAAGPNLRLSWNAPTANSGEYGISVQVKLPSEAWQTLTGVASVAAANDVQQLPSDATIAAVTDADFPSNKVGFDIGGLRVHQEYNARLVVFGRVSTLTAVTVATSVVTVDLSPTFTTSNDVSTLSELTISPDSGLSPTVAATTTTYITFLELGSGSANIIIAATATDSAATISGDGLVAVDIQDVGVTAQTITVTAEDGRASTDYTILFALPPSGFDIVSLQDTTNAANKTDIPFIPAAAGTTLAYTAGTNTAKTEVPRSVGSIGITLNWGNGGNTRAIGLRGETATADPIAGTEYIFALAPGVNHLDISYAGGSKAALVYTITIIRPQATAAPNAVTLLAADMHAANGFNINWEENQLADSYFVRWRINPNGAWQNAAGADVACTSSVTATEATCGEEINDFSVVSYALRGLQSDTLYDYSVRAVNSFGASNWSDGSAGTLPSANANLASLTLKHGFSGEALVLTPGFGSGVFAYSVTTVNALTVLVSAAVEDATADLKIGLTGLVNPVNNSVTDHVVSDLLVGQVNTLELTVTAEDDSSTQTYRIAITVDAPQSPQDFLQPLVVAEPGAPNLRLSWKTPTADSADYAIAVQVKLSGEDWANDGADVTEVGGVAALQQLPADAEFNALTGLPGGRDAADITGLAVNTEYDVRLLLLGGVSATADVARVAVVTNIFEQSDARTFNNVSTFSDLVVSGTGVGELMPEFSAETTSYVVAIAAGDLEDNSDFAITATAADAAADFAEFDTQSIAGTAQTIGGIPFTTTVTAEDEVATTQYDITLIVAPDDFAIPTLKDTETGAAIPFNITPSGTTFAYTAGTTNMRTVESSVESITIAANWSGDGVAATIGLRGLVPAAAVELTSATEHVFMLGEGESHIDIGFGGAENSFAYTITIDRRSPITVAPAAVVLAAVDGVGETAFNINWNQDAQAEKYFVRWRTSATTADANDAGAWQNAGGDDETCTDTDPVVEATCGVEIIGGEIETYSVTGLDDDTAYDYSVRAANRHGEAAWTESAAPINTAKSANANLTSLSLKRGDDSDLVLTPEFAADTFSYIVAFDAASVKISAAAEHDAATLQIGIAGAEVAIDGNTAADSSVTVSTGEHTLNIIVTAAAGNAQTYAVTLRVGLRPAKFADADFVTRFVADEGVVIWAQPVETVLQMDGYRLRWRGKSPLTAWLPNEDGGEFDGGNFSSSDNICPAAAARTDCLSATPAGLSGATLYQVQIAAENDFGVGEWSNSKDLQTGGGGGNPQPAPGNVRLTPGDASLVVNWNVAGGAHDYRVRWRTSATTADAAGAWQGWADGGDYTIVDDDGNNGADNGISIGGDGTTYTIADIGGSVLTTFDVQVASVFFNKHNDDSWSAIVSGAPTVLSVDAELATLTISVGELEYERATNRYDVPVPLATTEVTLTPELSDAKSSISVRVNYVVADAPGDPIALTAGGVTEIEVVVTAQNQSVTKTYIIRVSPATVQIDVDSDADGGDATDGLLIARYLLGLRGGNLTANINDTAGDAEIAAIEARIEFEKSTAQTLDVNGDNETDAADGIIIARYLHGVDEGGALIRGQADAELQTVIDAIGELETQLTRHVFFAQ